MGRREDGKSAMGFHSGGTFHPSSTVEGTVEGTGAGAHWLRQHQRPKDIVRFSWLVQNIRHRFDHIHVHCR